jgi:hypothetical protein
MFLSEQSFHRPAQLWLPSRFERDTTMNVLIGKHRLSVVGL